MLKKRNQKGFTLIEIIAVLVILGILAAVAVPKYLGLQEEAELSSAKGVVSELNGRASLAYAKKMLQNGMADGNTTAGYVSFDGAVDGWTGGPGANTVVNFTNLKRTGGSYNYGATWVTGDTNKPGYWNNVTKQ
jgi:prepilin-type N-terminal cleavage/methylation domain-containing protein